MLNHPPFLRFLVAFFAVVMILNCVSTDLAQSGRRARKTTPAAAPEPEPSPEPTPKASSEKPKPRYTFLIGIDRYGGFENIPYYAYERVLHSVSDRLGDAPSARVGGAQTEMSRSDAIDKAEGEKEAYVVWLQLKVDSLTGDTQNGRNLDNLEIEYMVYAPTTAKVVTHGGTYTRNQRSRGILNPPSNVSGDRYLNLAAQEAADKILSHFLLQAPPRRF